MKDRHHRLLVDKIRALTSPLSPRPTGTEEVLVELSGVKAVILDVYGTMFVSGCGDVGTTIGTSEGECFSGALAAQGIQARIDEVGRVGVELYSTVVGEHHARRRAEGVEYPEVEIRDVWREILVRLGENDFIDVVRTDELIEELAIEYESRVNPVSPMPELAETLAALRDRGVTLGIVSNAQFFTPLLFEALLGATVGELGFSDDLCVWSFQRLEGKPSLKLFRSVLDVLRDRGMQARELLYVGNDMRNDIWPASTLGMKTALFAADSRSLRLRADDANCVSVRPDVVLTALSQVVSVLES